MKQPDQQQEPSSVWWIRIGWSLAGVLWFAWIGIEDPSTFTVQIMASALLLALTITGFQRVSTRMLQSGQRRFIAIILIGFVYGLLITPTTTVLMAVKTSLHSHVVPDFTRGDVIQVLYSTPAWVMGCSMLAAAGALFEKVRQ